MVEQVFTIFSLFKPQFRCSNPSPMRKTRSSGFSPEFRGEELNLGQILNSDNVPIKPGGTGLRHH
jgi:hypothetical protein